MPKFRRKNPIMIEAVQWMGDNFGVIGEFSERIYGPYGKEESFLEIKTFYHDLKRVDIGDWIVRDEMGEVYPIKPHVFEEIYEPVDGD